MAIKLFNAWPADRYTHPVLPKGRGYGQVATVQSQEPLQSTWVVEDFEWNSDHKGLPRPALSTTPLASLCLPARLAASVIEDRRNLELLPIRVEREEWFVVHTLGIVDGVVDLASSNFSPMPAIEGYPERRVYKWLNLVHPQPLPGEFLRLRGSVYGPHVTESFVERVKALGLEGLQFELVGHVIADASQSVPKPAPPPPRAAETHKRRRQPRLTARPLPIGEVEELEQVGTAMRTRWRVNHELGTDGTLAALHAQVGQLKQGWFESSKKAQVDALIGLAAIFGDLICSVHGWSWVELRQGRDLRWIAVLSPSGSHALALVPFIHKQIESGVPTTTLLFNMIGAGSLPAAEPGQIVSIG